MKKTVLLIFLAGCMVGPNYREPENNVSDVWITSEDELEPMTDWWKVFDDPLLTKYIESAAEHNKDVLVAEANILQARATRMVDASALYPHIGVDFNALDFQFSKNGLIFGPAAAAGKSPKPESLFSALFDAKWEIDLFGKTRRQVEADTAIIGSNIERRNNILISVMAEIALNYMEVRSFQKKTELTVENIRLMEMQSEIVQKQFQFGYVSLLQLETILANLATAKAALPDIKANMYRSLYAMSVLTGDVPEALLEEMLAVQPLPIPPETIAVGLRSDLLRRRPDVRMAERQLAAKTASIGVAVAAFFPSIVLGGIEGLQSLHWKQLFESSSNIWAVGGNAAIPLFEGGKNVGNLRLNQAEQQAAFQTYQQTVLQALEETEGALIAFAQEKETAFDYRQATERYQTLVQLARQRYEKGLTNRLDYLRSEQQLVSSEQTLLESNTQVLIDLIALYKALGGGWESFTQ